MIDYPLLKTISLWGKYIGLATTATMAWINLHYKTTHDGSGAGYIRTLTPAGRIFRLVLIVSIVVTLLSAILENKVDSRLQKIAEEKGNQAVVNALRTQHETYVEDLKDQVEKRLLPKIDEGTRKLELAAGKVSSAVTGRNGYVYFEVPEPGTEPYVDIFVRTEGQDPQYDVFVEVSAMSNLWGMFRDIQHSYGTLPASLNGLRLLAPRLALKSPEAKYGIEINTRGGAYWQNVNFEEVDGKWYMATRVMVHGSGQVFRESIDEGFPRDHRGKIRW